MQSNDDFSVSRSNAFVQNGQQKCSPHKVEGVGTHTYDLYSTTANRIVRPSFIYLISTKLRTINNIYSDLWAQTAMAMVIVDYSSILYSTNISNRSMNDK